MVERARRTRGSAVAAGHGRRWVRAVDAGLGSEAPTERPTGTEGQGGVEWLAPACPRPIASPACSPRSTDYLRSVTTRAW